MACYTIEAWVRFKNDDPSEFCRKAKEKIEEMNLKPSFGKKEDFDFTDPLECFKYITDENVETCLDPGDWTVEFDATYHWESVLYDVLLHAAEGLADGSFFNIYPDVGQTHIFVKDGEVKYSSYETEEYETEEGDDEE